MTSRPKLEVPKDLRQMAHLLTQWGIWTRLGNGGAQSIIASLMNSVDKYPQNSRPPFLSNDDECCVVDGLLCVLKTENPTYFSWIDAHYRMGYPLKVLGKHANISEHKVVQILVAAEERLMAISDRAARLSKTI